MPSRSRRRILRQRRHRNDPRPGTGRFRHGFYKDFHIQERHTIEFRAELFNIFNHPNFNGIDPVLGSGTFGQVISAADPRIAEFALRYQF